MDGVTQGAPVCHMQAYRRHIVSEFLTDRHPYLENINSHLKHDDVSMAFGYRLFPRLVEQLNDPSIGPAKLVEALRTICDLASHQENKCQAISSDVVPAATNLLQHDSIEVRRDAARAISCMALLLCGRNVMPTGSSNMAKRVGNAMIPGSTLHRLSRLLLGCDDELVKMHVAEAFRTVARFRDGCQQTVDEGSAKAIAQYLVATLPELPATYCLSTCLRLLLQTLAAVTMYAQDAMRHLFGVGLIARIVIFLHRIPENHLLPAVTEADSTATVWQALSVLWHCGNDVRGRREMLDADAVRIITLYLNHKDAKVREATVCALNVISIETQGKKEVLSFSVNGLAQLLHSKNETTYLHETCVQLCRCASELPAFRFAFARHILSSTWLLEKIYGVASLSAVSPLLESVEAQAVRTEAAEVVLYFLSRSPGCGDEIRVPPVAPMENLEDPATFCSEECTSIVCNLLEILEFSKETAFECLRALTKTEKVRAELCELLAANQLGIGEEMVMDLQMML